MRSKHLLSLAFCLALIATACLDRVGAQTAKLAAKEPAAAAGASLQVKSAANNYVIGPGDLLAVNVWKEPEISRTVPVRPDGDISLPLAGDLVANGRTPLQLQNDIKQQLLTYLSDPEVTVVVQEAKSHKFNIVGEIEKPGSYTIGNPMTVLDAIAVAGGLRDFAKATKIYVLRVNPDGSHSRLPFNYKRVIKGRSLQDNVELQPSDTIVVP